MISLRACCALLMLFSTIAVSGEALAQTASACIAAPPLPVSNKQKVINVKSNRQLQRAIRNIRDNTTILISPGTYKLRSSIVIQADNVTIRGAANNCDSVHLVGPGMNKARYGRVMNGFWVSGKNARIANLTISEIYYHTITFDSAAQSPHIYNVRMINSGQQFVKVNPRGFGQGVNNGIVEYSIMEYTNGPSAIDRDNSGTGYTNGVDIHAGSGWRLSNNRFRNFHTPDNADHLSNAAVLVWNGAKNTITENNVFIDVDRSIAYGLGNRKNDHSGGVIRNNMIIKTPGLYSDARRSRSDASIIVWDSPGTKVVHNTVLTSGNTPKSIELRFDTSNVEVSNNITDAPIRHRDNKRFQAQSNLTNAKPNWFVHPPSGNLRLRQVTREVQDKVQRHPYAERDVDGAQRPSGQRVDLGADELLVQ